MPVKVIDHVYAQHLLTRLRDKSTAGIEFRKGLVRIGRIVGYELVKTFPVRAVEVETPLGRSSGVEIVGLDKVVIVQILRAAMPFVEGLLKAFPRAKLGVVAARRKEEGGRDRCRDLLLKNTPRHRRGCRNRGGPHVGHRHHYD